MGAALLAAAEEYTLEAVDVAAATPPDEALLLPGTRDEARAFAAFPLDLFLHVNVGDERAGGLYEGAGYILCAQHAAWEAPLMRRGAPRMKLMRKRLRETRTTPMVIPAVPVRG